MDTDDIWGTRNVGPSETTTTRSWSFRLVKYSLSSQSGRTRLAPRSSSLEWWSCPSLSCQELDTLERTSSEPAKQKMAGAGFGVERSETLSTRSVRTTRDLVHVLSPRIMKMAGAGFEPAT